MLESLQAEMKTFAHRHHSGTTGQKRGLGSPKIISRRDLEKEVQTADSKYNQRRMEAAELDWALRRRVTQYKSGSVNINSVYLLIVLLCIIVGSSAAGRAASSACVSSARSYPVFSRRLSATLAAGTAWRRHLPQSAQLYHA